MNPAKVKYQQLLLREGVSRCQVCLFPPPPHLQEPDHDAFTGGFSQADIEASARRGCENCVILSTLIAHSTRSYETARWMEIPLMDPFLHIFDPPFNYLLEICTPDPRFLQGNGQTGVDKAATDHPYLVYGTKLTGGTGDEGALSQAGRWLDDCRLNHAECQAKPNPNFIPSRLLRIDGSGEPFQLLEKGDKELQLPLAYATLSHRWNTETEAIILTMANLESRKKQGMGVHVLPTMMRDAILALCRLGFSHLWIDSLCIVQDSADDWQHEAGQMADVYSNAELTLSATWVPGTGQSLFNPREDPGEFSTMDIGPIQPNGTHPFFLRPTMPHFDVDRLDVSNRRFVASPGSWPLMHRGWVYQEQFLSRRSLHFTRHELVWVCREKQTCECGRLDQHQDDIPEDAYEPPSRWQTIIEAYSKRTLTKPSDRLPAIAGVAARYLTTTPHNEPPGRYLCGLWEWDLVSLLAWCVMEHPLPRDEELEPMPTWSWAAVTSPVVFLCFSFFDGPVEVVDVQVEYHGESFVGRVKKARLILAGPTVEGTIKVLPPLSKSTAGKPHHPPCLEPRWTSWLVHHNENRWLLSPDYMLCCSGEHCVSEGSKVMCLVFSSARDGEDDMFAIVLQEVPGTADSGRPLYRRIGCIQRWDMVADTSKTVLQRRTLEII